MGWSGCDLGMNIDVDLSAAAGGCPPTHLFPVGSREGSSEQPGSRGRKRTLKTNTRWSLQRAGSLLRKPPLRADCHMQVSGFSVLRSESQHLHLVTIVDIIVSFLPPLFSSRMELPLAHPPTNNLTTSYNSGESEIMESTPPSLQTPAQLEGKPAGIHVERQELRGAKQLLEKDSHRHRPRPRALDGEAGQLPNAREPFLTSD
uniref:Uncharacterized protein LOC123613036 n=1 Tax=Camelus bactrianus TaxID=9837 RepID=A0A9W3FMD3_CAMBA|nr:uncharacterized protein LOC123613036 [Camelus bactrianus]